MAKNKKPKKNANKVSVSHSVKTLSHSVLKKSYNTSKSSKPLLSVTGIKKNSSPIDESLGEGVANDDRLEVDDIDHSLTREPINLGVKNVRQILTCIKDSTLEVKDLILNECNIIYECKICTNLFRSLANFIAHKRIYCKNHFCEQMVLFDSTHFQFNEEDDDNCNDNELEDEEMANETNEVTESQTVQSQEPSTSLMSDIASPVSSSTNSLTENINPNDDQSIISKKRKFIENCVKKAEVEKIKEEESDQIEMHLTQINSNPNAVFQSVVTSSGTEDNCDQNFTNEVNKKNYILDLFKEAKSVGLNDSQAIKRQRVEDILPPIDMTEPNDNKDNQLKCDICESLFTSTKTLNVHIKTIHSSNRTVYPCPLCSLAFKHLSNATRHLIQIHKRTKTQANGLKEVLKRRAYSANSSENSSEVEDVSDEDNDRKSSLQTNNTRKHCENKSKSNNRSSLSGTENSKPNEKQTTRTVYTCVYKCGNTFDWPPAKKSHEKSCRKRHELDIQEDNETNHQTNGSHLTILSRDQRNISQKNCENDWTQETVPTTNSNHMSTNLTLPKSVEEKVKEFADLKSLRCTHCPTQDFMNLNQLLQHAVTHIGHSIYKCHGCSYQSIFENDMKYHLMNNHNINEDMISKHYQTLPNLTQPRLLILPIKSNGKVESSEGSAQSESPQSPDKNSNSKLKIHLRTMGNTSKKCYEIVDK